MLLHVFGCLLIDVLGVAATFVHELAVLSPTSPKWNESDVGQCAASSSEVRHDPVPCLWWEHLQASSLPRPIGSLSCYGTGVAWSCWAQFRNAFPQTSYSAVLAARREHLPFSCNRSRTRLLSFGDMFRIQQDHTSLRKVHRTAFGTCLCVPDQWRKLHTQLQENFSQLVVSHACSKPALKQWRTHRAGCSDAHPWSHDHSWMIHQGGSPRPRLRPWAWKMMMAREVVLRDVIDEEHERNRMRHTSCAGILWRRDVRCGFRQHSSIAKSEAAVLTGLPIKFARKSVGWPAWDVHECGCCSWCWEFQSRRHRKKWWHWHNPPAEIQHRFGFAHQLVEAQKIMTIGVISFQRRCSALPSASSLDFVHRVSSIVQLEFTIPRDGFRRISL